MFNFLYHTALYIAAIVLTLESNRRTRLEGLYHA